MGLPEAHLATMLRTGKERERRDSSIGGQLSEDLKNFAGVVKPFSSRFSNHKCGVGAC